MAPVNARGNAKDAFRCTALTSRPGHRQTAIQTLPTTLGIDSQTLVRLDHLRKQRNLTEYAGDLIPESAVTECVAQAQSLYTVTHGWIKRKQARPVVIQ